MTALTDDAGGPLDRALGALRVATERLNECVEGEASAEELASAYAERESSFEALRVLVASGEVLGAAGRAQLRAVQELDVALIALGAARSDAVRQARRDLVRRRNAIHAHGTREREAPRALTLKA